MSLKAKTSPPGSGELPTEGVRRGRRRRLLFWEALPPPPKKKRGKRGNLVRTSRNGDKQNHKIDRHPMGSMGCDRHFCVCDFVIRCRLDLMGGMSNGLSYLHFIMDICARQRGGNDAAGRIQRGSQK